jgi:Tfp pilus assembly protein PilW
MMNFKRQYKKQLGLTLVELLVALVLGVVLIGGITKVYLENKKNYVQDDGLARMQENGRYVLNVLKREITMVGFFAGTQEPIYTDTVTHIKNDCHLGWALDARKPLDFFNVPTTLASSVLGESYIGCIKTPIASLQPNSDIIAIKRTAGAPTINNGIYTDSNTNAGTKKNNSFYVKLIDRSAPELVHVESSFTLDVTTPNSVPSSQVSMWVYQAKLFYVRNFSVTPGDNVPTLMMVALQDKSMVEASLAEGVEAFHVEFGIPSASSNGVPVQFVQNPTNEQILEATVMRIYVLMRTRNPISAYTDSRSYFLGSSALLKPGGNYMRRVFTTTIKLRNALNNKSI